MDIPSRILRNCAKSMMCLAAAMAAIFDSGGGSVVLAGTLPTFSATASGMINDLTLTARLEIADADVGRSGNVYLVAIVGSTLFVHNGVAWEPWLGGAIPVFAAGTLASRSIEVVSDADMTALIGTRVYVGYGLSEEDMLANNKYGLVYTVSGEQMLTPYVNAAEIASIVQVFNSSGESGAPNEQLRYVHDGLDIVPNSNLTPFRAVCSGRVDSVLATEENIVVFLACDSAHVVEYVFEPQASQAGAGQTQLANMAVVAGQVVSRGDVIGNLYVGGSEAHVHFAIHKNFIPQCPEPYFAPDARESILGLVHISFPGAAMCYGGNVTPPFLITPYVAESDMASINESFSVQDSAPPWGFAHNGIDFFPQGDLQPFRAVCSGTVDSLALWQNERSANWQVNLLLECDQYVFNTGGYFPPFSIVYAFEPMSHVQEDGQTQLANISVADGQSVSQGDILGHLFAVGAGAHVHFGVLAYGSSSWSAIGVPSIALCPEPHFSPEAQDSILNLLRSVWPDAALCYQ